MLQGILYQSTIGPKRKINKYVGSPRIKTIKVLLHVIFEQKL